MHASCLLITAEKFTIFLEMDLLRLTYKHEMAFSVLVYVVKYSNKVTDPSNLLGDSEKLILS